MKIAYFETTFLVGASVVTKNPTITELNLLLRSKNSPVYDISPSTKFNVFNTRIHQVFRMY